MFKYGLKKPVASMESSEMNPGEVDGSKRWSADDISAGAYKYIMTDVFRGIAYSLSSWLKKRGETKEAINAKISQLLNLAVTNDDIDEEYKKYLLECDYSERIWDNYAALSETEPSGGWSCVWDIMDAARSGVDAAAQCTKSYQDKMTPAEKALLDNLRIARDAYNKAREEYDRYVQNNAIMMINEVFVKYADTLMKIAKEWYDVCEAPLRDWVARAQRSIQEKKAAATASNATPAE